ncbi:RagB/SusD family nutrient uptake outer membrane protein [Flavobacterium sp.]
MKRIKLGFISSLFAFFVFSSCEDSYNIVQDGELNESAVTTVPLLQQWLNGVYANVTIANEIGFTGIFTDETSIGRGNGGQNLGLHSFFLTTGENYASAMWYGHYQTINRVNRLMRMVTDPDAEGPAQPQVALPTDPAELAQYNSIISQARALRAFSYFQLLTYFSTDLTDDNELGVMFFLNVPEASDLLPRSTNGVVFAQIEADLAFAFDNLGTPTLAANTPAYKYVSKNMINALRARMYLYRENYPLAKQYAQDVIANSGLSLTLATPVPANPPTNPTAPNNTPGGATTAWNNAFYGTNPPSPYRRMFNDIGSGVQGEILFGLDRPVTGNWGNVAAQFTTNSSNLSGSPLFEVSRRLFAKLCEVPGDVRRYANVDPTSIFNPNYLTDPNYIATDVIVIDKYPGRTGNVLRNDQKVFRLSEMYFILAECLANEGNINGATNSVASIIKQIKDARNFLSPQPLPVYADATAALSAILNERRIELCFEGQRYIDIKRLGPVVGETLDRDPTDDLPGAPLSIPNDDYRFTLPIPLDELIANPGIQQNPGYL